jgi:hypothetical protein
MEIINIRRLLIKKHTNYLFNEFIEQSTYVLYQVHKRKTKTHVTNHKLVDTLKRKSTNGTLKVPCEVLPVISLDIVN